MKETGTLAMSVPVSRLFSYNSNWQSQTPAPHFEWEQG